MVNNLVPKVTSFPQIMSKLSFYFLLTTSSVYALNPAYHNLEVSLAGGVDWYHSSNSDLVISSLETDSVKVSNASANGAWKIGLGYYFFEDRLSNQNYFNHLLIELNIYQTTTTLNGSVWQYGLAEFNNYNFEAPITSTRLMLDVKPTIFNWKNFSPYFLLGFGVSRNEASYHETANSGISSASALSLSKSTTNQFAWEAGLGFKFDYNQNISATAEYNYANLGSVTPSKNSSNVAMLSAPNFSLSAQSLLVGLSYKF